MKRWRKFWSFSSAERRLLLEAAAALLKYRIGVRLVPIKRILERLQVGMGKADKDLSELQLATADQVAWAVNAAGRHLPGNYVCLPRALTAMQLLLRRKIPCTLCFGAATKEDQLKAHAWLSCGKKILTGERESRQYPTVATFAPVANES